MTRPEADAMLRAWGERHGLPGTFNAAGLSSVSIGTTPVTLEWDAASGAVLAHAVVYRFKAAAAPGVVEKVTRAGLEYLSESGALCVRRAFEQPLSADVLDAQLETLVASSLRWATEGLDSLFA